jgi:hypothetical protein
MARTYGIFTPVFGEHTRRAEPSSKFGDQERLGVFKGLHRRFPCDRRKIVQELVECLATFEVVEQRLERHPRPQEYGRSPQHIGIAGDHVIVGRSNGKCPCTDAMVSPRAVDYKQRGFSSAAFSG